MNPARRVDQRLKTEGGEKLAESLNGGAAVFALLVGEVHKVCLKAAAFKQAEAF